MARRISSQKDLELSWSELVERVSGMRGELVAVAGIDLDFLGAIAGGMESISASG